MTRALLPLAIIVLAACEPKLESQDWLVTAARVLAVAGEPAEAKPGVAIAYSALIANPGSPDDSISLVWSLCLAPKPLAENNVVSAACLDSASLVTAGNGPSTLAATPNNACALFGPDTPTGDFRPRDPDASGGYYQPLRVDLLGAEPSFHLQRIQCGPAEAPAELAERFAKEYLPNQNPKLGPLHATSGGQPVSLDQIPLGARVELSLSWATEDAERYTTFDRASQMLVTRREVLRVAWYADLGTLASESTATSEEDAALDASNVWTAPRTAGTAQLWLVLRDSRGGVGYGTFTLTVRP